MPPISKQISSSLHLPNESLMISRCYGSVLKERHSTIPKFLRATPAHGSRNHKSISFAEERRRCPDLIFAHLSCTKAARFCKWRLRFRMECILSCKSRFSSLARRSAISSVASRKLPSHCPPPPVDEFPSMSGLQICRQSDSKRLNSPEASGQKKLQ